MNEPCPGLFKRVTRSGNITATLSIDSGRVVVTCHDDSLNEIIHWQSEIIDSNRTIIHEGLVQNMQYQTHWYDYFCRTAVGISLFLLLLLIVLHALKLPLP